MTVEVETAMRFVVRAGIIVSLAFAVLSMHGSTSPTRAFARAIDTIAMPGVMMPDSHSVQDMNVHGAGAICLWTLVGGVLLALGRKYSARLRRVRSVASPNAIGAGYRSFRLGPRPVGPDPPFLLCTLRR